tara:strand:+ start:807 stop:1184 length:378 start_codon:yes stop_codon:yes gene_type:complete
MTLPNHLLYTKEHEWIEFKDDLAIVGITDYAQSQLGDVIFVEFPEIGANLDIGSSFGEIEAVKTVSDLFAPISGNVISINDEIEDTPDLVNTDPYGEGWLIKMSPTKNEQKEELMDADEYKKFIS